MALTGLAIPNSYAEETTAIQESIQADCNEEAKNSESSATYYKECVAERMQSFNEDQNGNGDIQPDRG